MAYNSTTKVLSSSGGIKISEVAECLGETTKTLNNLCVSAGIKMWAKHKPVCIDKFTKVTDAEKKAMNYGLIPPRITGSSSFFDFFDSVDVWTYDHPTGGEDEPFRLGDFVSSESTSEGYNHNCSYPPIYAGTVTYNTALNTVSGSLVTNPYSTGLNGAIQLSDLGSYQDWYLAIAIRKGSSGSYSYYYKTASDKLSSITTINMTASEASLLGNGTYTFVLCMCNKKGDKNGSTTLHLYNTSSSGTDYSDALFIPIPCDNVTQTKGSITVTADINMTVVLSSAVAGTNTSSPFPVDISDYTRGITPGESSSNPSLYLNVAPSYTISLKLKITNNTGAAYNFSVSNLKIKVAMNLSGIVNLTVSPKSVLNATYTAGQPYSPRTNLNMSAGETIEFIVNLPDNVLSFNSSGVADPTVTSSSKLKQGAFEIYNNTVKLGTVRIRIRNNL